MDSEAPQACQLHIDPNYIFPWLMPLNLALDHLVRGETPQNLHPRNKIMSSMNQTLHLALS